MPLFRVRPGCATLLASALLLAGSGPVRAQRDTLDLVVAATTDVHGRLRGWDYYTNSPDTLRGLTRAATIVDSVRAANPGRVLLLDAGDILEGNPLAYIAAHRHFARQPVIAAMNAMRYDAAAIGNHEFNYGLPALRRAVAQARFPMLAANAYLPSGAHAFAARRIIPRGGVKVGIVGGTTPGSNLWDHDNLHGKLVIRDIVPAVDTAVRAARRAGADVIVVVLHSGLDEPSSYDTVATGLPSENVAARVAHEVPGIDLIVYGHSHKQMADTVIAGVLLVQPKNWATSVGVAHLKLQRQGTGWHVGRSWSGLVQCAGHVESLAIVAATAAVHQATVAYVSTPIGHTAVSWRGDSARVADTPLIDFVLDVERSVAHADLASTAAFTLDAALDSGPITIAEVARLYPYDNTLKAVRLTGRQLRDYLEFSARYFGQFGTDEPAVDPRIPGYNFDIVAGADYTIDLSRPIGSRITSLTVRGKPVADTDTFTLALNNYRQSGGGGYAMLRDAPVVYDGQVELRQLLIEAVQRHHELDPAAFAHHDWSIVPTAAAERAYVAMHRPFGAGRRVPTRVRPEPRRLPVTVTPPSGDTAGRAPNDTQPATRDTSASHSPR